MTKFQTLYVFPAIPESLQFLDKLSRNLWWSWRREAVELFRRIDPKLWRESNRNPIHFSTLISQERLLELSQDESFLSHLRQVREYFESSLETNVGHSTNVFDDRRTIAYFSMEFGIHESLPLFAGGLGILAGDHLKSASDMGVPLTGIGLFFRQGYFHQYLDYEGYQQEEYPRTDFFTIPLERALDSDGNEVCISVTGPDGIIHAVVWKLSIGRIALYLLDTNIKENPPEIRDITSSLYTGDQRKRLAQEILLGIGGIRALSAMGIFPSVCHMNEGHCAFASYERLALYMSTYDIDLKTAMEIVTRTTVFTTHTPVAAGHDEFPPYLIKPYFIPLEEKLKTTAEEMLAWGHPSGSTHDQPFSMFVLGKNMSQHCNGVSRLHGKVARRMWAHLWPDLQESEVPITHITNGVHVPTWISNENAVLFERYIGPNWHMKVENPEILNRFEQIYDEEIWHAHEMNRSRLIRYCREMLVKQYKRRRVPLASMKDAESVLDQDVLTIVFARRFASYKRAYLILMDTERFEAMLNSKTHPVQFIFSGKAHPRDTEGKDLIKRLIEFSKRPSVRHRIVFLEDYSIDIARHLVQGADVWLNTPRRPFEACGTSGIKAAINGVLNVSIMDGWWDEGYSEDCGWQIGNGYENIEAGYQDILDSRSLYNILENEVIPCFYDRSKGTIPVNWIRMMKASMKMAMGRFSSHRMVNDYITGFYYPAGYRSQELLYNNSEEARQLVQHRERLMMNWEKIQIFQPVTLNPKRFYRIGETFAVTVAVNLGELSQNDVDVELCLGKALEVDKIGDIQTETMIMRDDFGNGHYVYVCTTICNFAGQIAFTARVTPRGDTQIKYTSGLITWAK